MAANSARGEHGLDRRAERRGELLGVQLLPEEGAGPRAAQWEASSLPANPNPNPNPNPNSKPKPHPDQASRVSAAMRELLTGDFSTAVLG